MAVKAARVAAESTAKSISRELPETKSNQPVVENKKDPQAMMSTLDTILLTTLVGSVLTLAAGLLVKQGSGMLMA